ncbi:ATP-dependent DNA helicase Q1-like [Acropora palmata]|uniref:ATP-dependent DNA helicase Q1-like n=1 Tax=Acropora palmata TaxID=6131 RepID=UPI003DA04C67
MELAKELDEIDLELKDIETNVESLLKRQVFLQSRKQLIQAQISSGAVDNSLPSTSAKKEDNQNWSVRTFPWSEKIEKAREDIFKIKKFRPLQLECMNASMAGKDCILIMPTGGGKSLCFQLPSVISKGMTLVISPLISLMEDQLMALKELKIDSALLNSKRSKEEVNSVQSAMVDKKSGLKLLYVTPEKIAKSKRFMAKLEKMFEGGRLSRLVIDEVHCTSQWGHDFRPDYKFLGILKQQFPGVPMLGLTATATSKVIADVKKILGLQEDCVLFKASFNRPNLYYEVRYKPSNHEKCMDEIKFLVAHKFPSQSGIVYCFSKKDSVSISSSLMSRGIKAACYHGDLDGPSRSYVHSAWMKNAIQVVVATVAFGMGIDKPDVRFVIHHSLSKSMENYYQESGRAGRDDNRSHCILFYRPFDVFQQSAMVFTEQTGLENLYGMLAYCHDLKTCRRTLTGRHFSEQWKSDECHEMCDNCRRTGDQSDGSRVPFVQREITNYCKDILLILERASSLSERVTANKLVDLWCGKGKPNLRVRDVKTPDLSREDCERVIVDMLLEGVLREDFHFTPYSTISYLLPGPKAGLIHSGKRLYMDFRDDSDSKSTPKKAKKRQSNRPSHSKTSNASKSKMAKTDGEVRNPSETTVENDDDENDSVSCAKRMKPSKQLFIDDSDDDDTSEIVVLD